jgi:hypothetical protein
MNGATGWRSGGTKWREIGLSVRKSREIKGNQAPAREIFFGNRRGYYGSAFARLRRDK